jgi:hypothetical protein
MRWREQDAVKEETNRKEKEQIHKNKKKPKEEGDVRDRRNKQEKEKGKEEGDVRDREREKKTNTIKPNDQKERKK